MISEGAEATPSSVTNGQVNSQVVHERLVASQELNSQELNSLEKNSLEKNNSEVLLAKAEGSSFSTPLKNLTETELNKLKSETELEIKKLDLTLNRFYDAARKSGNRETQIRKKKLKCNKQLVYEIGLQNQLATQLNQYKKLFEIQNQKLSDYSVGLKFLLLQSDELPKTDKERTQLLNKIVRQEQLISELKSEKNSMQSKYESQLTDYKLFEEKINRLKNENDKNDSLLREAVKKTNYYALEMDHTQEKINAAMAQLKKLDMKLEEIVNNF